MIHLKLSLPGGPIDQDWGTQRKERERDTDRGVSVAGSTTPGSGDERRAAEKDYLDKQPNEDQLSETLERVELPLNKL